MAADIDVTSKVEVGWVDDEVIGLDRCVCGTSSIDTVGVDRDDPWQCPMCGRELYIRQTLTVLEKRV